MHHTIRVAEFLELYGVDFALDQPSDVVLKLLPIVDPVFGLEGFFLRQPLVLGPERVVFTRQVTGVGLILLVLSGIGLLRPVEDVSSSLWRKRKR